MNHHTQPWQRGDKPGTKHERRVTYAELAKALNSASGMSTHVPLEDIHLGMSQTELIIKWWTQEEPPVECRVCTSPAAESGLCESCRSAAPEFIEPEEPT